MSYSLNEFQALARKAARGSGVPWGIAEEAGMASRYLCEHGLNGAESLCQALGQPPKTNPLYIGPALSDGAWAQQNWQSSQPMHAPALLIPFAALSLADTDIWLHIAWDGVSLYLSKSDLIYTKIDQIHAAGPIEVKIETGEAGLGKALQKSSRAQISKECYRALERLAEKTYAPATEASRLTGAGAGLNDND